MAESASPPKRSPEWTAAYLAATRAATWTKDPKFRDPLPRKELAEKSPACRAAFPGAVEQALSDISASAAAASTLEEALWKHPGLGAPEESPAYAERKDLSEKKIALIHQTIDAIDSFRGLLREAIRVDAIEALPEALLLAFGREDCSGVAAISLAEIANLAVSDFRSYPNPHLLSAFTQPNLWNRSAPAWRELSIHSGSSLNQRSRAADWIACPLIWAGRKKNQPDLLRSYLLRAYELAEVHGAIGDPQMDHFCGRGASSLFHSAFATPGPVTKQLSGELSSNFWLGFLSGMGGKAGDFAFEVLMSRTSDAPSIPAKIAQLAWTNADRRLLNKLEAALPGSSAKAIPLLEQKSSGIQALSGRPQIGALEASRAKWLQKALFQASGMEDIRSASDWALRTDGSMALVVRIQMARMEAAQLRKSAKSAAGGKSKRKHSL